MKVLCAISLMCVVLLAGLGTIGAQTWTPLANLPPNGAGNPHLLTDGRVMVQGDDGSDWWALTPDNTGSYINGTWSALASNPGYCPQYYASAVLADGRLVMIGGEYNCGQEFTSQGAVYNPRTNTWKNLAPPKGPHWNGSITGYGIGDSAGVVLANGAFMVACAGCGDPGYAAYATPAALRWTATGAGKLEGGYDEEGLTLLPNGKVLTVGVYGAYNSQLYDPATGTWGDSINTVVDFVANNPGSEIGPAVLRPDGTVLQIGGNGQTIGIQNTNAVFNTATETWSAAPSFPLDSTTGLGLDAADAPASILPNGNVLVSVGPGYAQPGVFYYEWDGTNFNPVPGTPNAANELDYGNRFLVLPTGEVLKTGGGDLEVYSTSGGPDPSWAPTIASVPVRLHPGDLSRKLTGTQLNGLSQGAAYGDDFQDATNYPLVRITNNSSGHVVYCRTRNHSSMGVATGTEIVSTYFDVPSDIELGASKLVVVANGIPSLPVGVTIIPPVKGTH